MSAATARPQTAMRRLAGALAFVCLVLFLLAIEQKHTVAAWETLRDEAGPAARRVAEVVMEDSFSFALTMAWPAGAQMTAAGRLCGARMTGRSPGGG